MSSEISKLMFWNAYNYIQLVIFDSSHVHTSVLAYVSLIERRAPHSSWPVAKATKALLKC